MIDFDKITKPEIKECVSGDTKIVKHKSKEKYKLFINNQQWMAWDRSDYSGFKDQFGSYDLAYGNVITSGLGFGILQSWLATKKEIESILVVEKNKNVIDFFKENNKISSKITIINEDINLFKTNKKVDTLLLDHYEQEELDDQVKNMRKIYKNIPNHDIFYSWRIELIYASKFLKSYFDIGKENKWKEFKKYLKINTLPDLSDNQIKEYCSLFLFQKTYEEFMQEFQLDD